MPKAKGGICGPWIPDDGQIFTHTVSTAGKMTQTNWTAKVKKLKLFSLISIAFYINGLKNICGCNLNHIHETISLILQGDQIHTCNLELHGGVKFKCGCKKCGVVVPPA